MQAQLNGRILNDVGAPLAGVKVSLFGGAEALRDDARAAIARPAAVSWTRAERGITGATRGVWLKLIAPTTAGITWEEFREQAPSVNPSLRETQGRFHPDRLYLLPENRHSAEAEIAWDRPLSGFGGDRWACWQECVQNKVIGLDWRSFRRAVLAHNPGLAAAGGVFSSDRTYLLPHNAGQETYARVAYTRASGRFAFPDLKPGAYRLEVVVPGYEPWTQEVEAGDGRELRIRLNPTTEPVTRALLISPQGIPFVQVRGSEFVLANRAFRFIGVNLRGLVHYGAHPFELSSANQRQQLQAASDMGARVVRVFLPIEYVDWRLNNEIERRLDALLKLMESEFRHMYLIVCLTNLYEDTPFKVFGDQIGDSAYDTPWDNKKLLGRRWFATRYQENYLKFIRQVVPKFQERANIMAWEPGNELKVDNDPRTFVDFMLRIAQELQALAPNHLVTTGMISTQHAHMDPDNPNIRAERLRLLSSPHIDFFTVHSYNGRDEHKEEADAREVARLKKPLIVEEAGFVAGTKVLSSDIPGCVKDGRRRDCVEADLNKWFDSLGARGYLQWGFMVGDDNSDGDGRSGLDHAIHGREDWDELRALYRSRADALASQAGPVAPPTSHEIMGPAAPPSHPIPQPAAPAPHAAGPAPHLMAALSAPPAAADAGEFAAGQQITVVAARGVNVRRVPGYINKLAGDVLATLPRGARLTVVEGPRPVDGLTWWEVGFSLRGQSVRGWVAQVDPQGVRLIGA